MEKAKKLLSAGSDNNVIMWDLGSSKELYKLYGSTASVIQAKFTPDGGFVAAAGNDSTIRLWSLRTQRQITVFNGHTNKVTCLAFSSDSKRMFSGSHDRTIRIWDMETGACRHVISTVSMVNGMDLSPDEYWIGTCHLDGSIRFWSISDRKEMIVLKDHCPNSTNGIQFSPPEGIQVLTSSKDGKIIVWDFRKNKKLFEIENKNYKNSNLFGHPTYSPDGQFILGGSTSSEKDGTYALYLWKAKTGELLNTLNGHETPVNCVLWDGRGGVVSCDQGGMISTWV